MLIHRHLRFKSIALLWIILAPGIVVGQLASAMCYSTPRSAVDAISREPSSHEALTSGDFRVARIQSDPVLRISWAIVSSCVHPERPPLVLPITGAPPLRLTPNPKRSSNESSEGAPVIHAGDIVRLWSEKQFLRIEVAAISQESGGLGKTIKVRLSQRDNGNRSIPEVLVGVVRGPSNVEIQW